MIKVWEEKLYSSTFDSMFDSLVEQYKNGEVSISDIEINMLEQQQILLNSFHEGETKSIYCNAMVDAYQFVLSLVNNGKISKEDQK